MAPSSDNMQPWEFDKQDNAIEVYCVKERLLAIDVMDMFSWMSIGAAIQNIVVKSAAYGFLADVEYVPSGHHEKPEAIIRLFPGGVDTRLDERIALRTTNRLPFLPQPLEQPILSELSQAADRINSGLHWLNPEAGFESLVSMDAAFSSILLEHKPLFDGLFDTIRFTRGEIEEARCGMDIKSLDIPFIFAFIARRFRRLKINRLISRLGIGPVVAKTLSSRLRRAGALCLVTAEKRTPAGYMEAGRAMEALWLSATAHDLSVHPYGVIPQYFAMAECKPEAFLPKHRAEIESYRQPFLSLFPNIGPDSPAIMLRIGRAGRQSVRSTIRFRPEQIIRTA